MWENDVHKPRVYILERTRYKKKIIIDPAYYKLKKAVGAVSQDDASKERPMLPLTALMTNIRPCSSVCLYVPMYIYMSKYLI